MKVTVVVLAKVPGAAPVKTRLIPALGEAGARELFLMMMRATLRLARRVDPLPVVAYSPPDADAAQGLPGLGPCRFEPTFGSTGTACLAEALRGAFRGGPLVALGGDAPDLPLDRVRAAVEWARSHGAAYVPTGDGGFSCLALARPLPCFETSFPYGGSGALRGLEAFLRAAGLDPVALEPWPDVDTPADLAALNERSPGWALCT